MKKILSLVLAFALVLSIASVAAAGLWDPTPASTSDFGYKISVQKYALTSGLYSFSYVAGSGAAAINSADVYYVVKLTVPNLQATDAIRVNAQATVTLEGIAGTSLTDNDISALDAGTYYYDGNGNWVDASTLTMATVNTPVVRAFAYDASSAKISAKVVSNRPLTDLTGLTWKGYTLTYTDATPDTLELAKGTENIIFNIADGDGKASKLSGTVTGTSTFESDLFAALGFTAADLNNGNVYFTAKNLRAVFGFAHSTETATVSWGAATTPIILDNNAIGIGIPKTGDNASVIGFALVMIAVVGAAVAVKKVRA